MRTPLCAIACAICLLTVLSACSGKKSDGDAAMQDSTQTQQSDAPYADPSQTSTSEAILGGKHYEITIARSADKSLPVVTDDMGKTFYENRVDVTVKCDGEDLFHKSYSKEAFADFLTSATDRQGTVLLGMAFDKSRSNASTICLGAQIGQIGIEEGPAFCVEIPLNGGAASIVRDNKQDTAGEDGLTD